MQMVLAAAGATSTMARRVRVRFCGHCGHVAAALVDMSPAAANSDLVVYIFVRHYSKLEYWIYTSENCILSS